MKTGLLFAVKSERSILPDATAVPVDSVTREVISVQVAFVIKVLVNVVSVAFTPGKLADTSNCNELACEPFALVVRKLNKGLPVAVTRSRYSNLLPTSPE